MIFRRRFCDDDDDDDDERGAVDELRDDPPHRRLQPVTVRVPLPLPAPRSPPRAPSFRASRLDITQLRDAVVADAPRRAADGNFARGTDGHDRPERIRTLPTRAAGARLAAANRRSDRRPSHVYSPQVNYLIPFVLQRYWVISG